MSNLIDKRNENTERILNDVGAQVVAEIRQALADTGTNASGRTSASLRYTVEGGVLEVLGRPAFGTVEHGRKAGRVPRNFVSIIAQWIVDKGLTLDIRPVIRPTSRDAYTRALHRAAGAIAWKIRTEGSKLHRDGGRDDIYTPAVKRAAEAIGQYLNDVAISYLE